MYYSHPNKRRHPNNSRHGMFKRYSGHCINNRRHLNKSRREPFLEIDQKCSNSNSNEGNFGPASKNCRPLLNQS